MMLALLVYAYSTGVFSSRKIERRTYEDVAFRYLAGGQHPEFSTICAFRRAHLRAIEGLFVQIVRLCGRAGLARLGHVSLDGTKVHANASKHKR
jgi:transposase